jgi:hypothetical protein
MDSLSDTTLVSARSAEQLGDDQEFNGMTRSLDHCMEEGNTTLIVIVKEPNVRDLEAYCRPPPGSLFKRLRSKLEGSMYGPCIHLTFGSVTWPSLLTLLIFFLNLERSLPTITTRQNVQQAIDKLPRNGENTKLVILASDRIRNISCRISRTLGFHSLTILRSGVVTDNSETSQPPLLISGRSKFNGIRFDEWEEEDRASSLVLGPNIRIKINVNGRSTWTQAYRNTDRPEHLDAATKHVTEISRRPGQDWEDWRGIVSAVMGVAVGAGTFVLRMTAAAAGVFVQYKFGAFTFTAGAGLASATVITALGTGTLLGVGGAAAVYFIPWVELSTFVETFIQNFWSRVVGFWTAICNWVASLFSSLSALQRRHGEFRPMFDFMD